MIAKPPMQGRHEFNPPFTKRDSPENPRSNLSSSRRLLVVGLLAAPILSYGQDHSESSNVATSKIQITIAVFKGESAISHEIASVVLADLHRCGQFQGTVEPETSLDEFAPVDTNRWKNKGIHTLVCGSVSQLPDRRIRLGIRIWNTAAGRDVGGLNLTVDASEIRGACHRTADYVYATLTGKHGIFSTRIAYVNKLLGRHSIQVADADGLDNKSAFSSPEPIISPTWSPDGKQIAYASFESRKPDVYAHELITGRRRLMASFNGSASACAWAPDGASIAVTLRHQGESTTYILDPVGTAPPKNIMRSNNIDAGAKFSPDGKALYFTSDRSGSPQIHKMSLEDGRIERITFEGRYNISPAVSPDGKWMAFVARIEDQFKLKVMDLSTGTTITPTDTLADESPCFAPNSQTIMYATQIDGEEVLMASDIGGLIKTNLVRSLGKIREPCWGPILMSSRH